MSSYFTHCEDIYRRWLGGENFNLPNKLEAEFAPEPYLLFDGETIEDEGPKLVFLTTNPGGGAIYQKKEPLGYARDETYLAFQSRMVGCYYRSGVLKGTAGTRIMRMRQIARELCRRRLISTSGFIQCEMVPFHSESLPGKAKLGSTKVIEDYWKSLEAFLANHHVIALDSARLHDRKTGSPIYEAKIWEDEWLLSKAQMFGLTWEATKVLKTSDGVRPSLRLFRPVRRTALIRGHYLADGTNNFGKNITELCDAIEKDEMPPWDAASAT